MINWVKKIEDGAKYSIGEICKFNKTNLLIYRDRMIITLAFSNVDNKEYSEFPYDSANGIIFTITGKLPYNFDWSKPIFMGDKEQYNEELDRIVVERDSCYSKVYTVEDFIAYKVDDTVKQIRHYIGINQNLFKGKKRSFSKYVDYVCGRTLSFTYEAETVADYIINSVYNCVRDCMQSAIQNYVDRVRQKKGYRAKYEQIG